MVSPTTFQTAVLVVQLLVTVVGGLLVYIWRGKVAQIDENADRSRQNERRWRYIAGDEQFNDDGGRLGAFDRLHDELRRDHQETKERLESHSAQLNRILSILEESDAIDADVRDDDYRITDDD